MIRIEYRGSFKRTERFLAKISNLAIMKVLESCAKDGVEALSRETPRHTGQAAYSWGYEVSKTGGVYSIVWTNSDVENGFPVVIMLQYGHGTGTGGYVQGYDFINPAIRPVFDKIADQVWMEVTSA